MKSCQQLLQNDSQDESSTESQPNPECLRNTNARVLPVDLDVKNFLESMKDSSQVCSHEGSLRARMNELLTELQTIHLKSFENFLENIWNRLFAIVSARVSNSQGNKKIDFRGICSDEIELLTCDAISLQFSSVIQNNPLQVHHHCILTEVVKNISKMILRQHEGTVNCEQMEQEQMEGIAMSGANKNCYGKVRYVSGWVVAKLIHCQPKLHPKKSLLL